MENRKPIFPEDDGYFDNIKIAEIIDYYDGAKIFTFLTQSDDYYLAYFCDDSETGTVWLNFPVNNYQLDKFLKNQVSIRDFFKLCHIAFLVERGLDDKVSRCEKCLFEQIPADYIPDEDVFLEKQDDALTVRILKEGLSPGTIKESVLIKVVSVFCKAVRNIMKEIKKTDHDFALYSSDPKLSLSNILYGSVGITLKPIEHNPLFNESVNVIHKVMSNTSGVAPELTNKVKKTLYPLIPNPCSRYFNFDAIQISGRMVSKTDVVPVDVRLVGSLREEYQSVIQEVEKGIKNVVLFGVIREYDRDNDSFILRNIDENAYDITEVECGFDTDDLSYSGASDEDILEYFRTAAKVEVTGRYSEKDKKMESHSIRVVKP